MVADCVIVLQKYISAILILLFNVFMFILKDTVSPLLSKTSCTVYVWAEMRGMLAWPYSVNLPWGSCRTEQLKSSKAHSLWQIMAHTSRNQSSLLFIWLYSSYTADLQATHKGKKVNTSLTCNAVVSHCLIWERDKIHETELNSFPRAEGQIE